MFQTNPPTLTQNNLQAKSIILYQTTLISLPHLNLIEVIPSTIKLDRHDFLIWKSQILPTIRAYCLEGHLNGTKPRPNQNTIAIDQDQSVVINPNSELRIQLDTGSASLGVVTFDHHGRFEQHN